MSNPTCRILAFAGSARRDSFNKRMVQIAAQGARDAGAEVTYVDLKEYPLPIFDQDLEAEQGPPANAVELKKLFLAHQGLLIASPEYNSTISPLLKNTLDWVSRPTAGETRLAAYIDKVAVLMAASPGALGGLRGLVHLRAMLQNVGVVIIPQQYALGNADQVFGADGQLVDPSVQATVTGLGEKLAQYLGKIHG